MSKFVHGVACGAGPVYTVITDSVTVKCPQEASGGTFSLFEVTVPAQSGPPLHRHGWDEAYYVLEGCIEVRAGDATTVLRPGDFSYVPGDTAHAYRGLDATPSRMLVWSTPGGAESFFAEMHDQVRVLPDDVPKIFEIAGRYGIAPVA